MINKDLCMDLGTLRGNNLASDETLFYETLYMYFTKINFCNLWLKKKE